MTYAEQLRKLPAVDEILRHDHLRSLVETYPRPQIVEWVRTAIDECRNTILTGAAFDEATSVQWVVRKIQSQAIAENGRRQQPVINATGILLHTNLGRAPLADRAIQRMQESAGYANVEMNLYTGKRNKRGERACSLLSQLTGAEDGAIVNNCAAATMLVLQAFAKGREVIISRGQLVEIGGGYRLPEVFAASGALMKEVGTTNRTYLRDYENAINENTAAIIQVHRSNFYLGGFVTEPNLSDLVALGKKRNIPVIDDIGSGCIGGLGGIGLQEPTVPASIAAGADVTLFSGDKLFGGPQAGIIVGRSHWIETLRRNPMMRALRVDKVTLAAIEATAEIHLSGRAKNELPLLQMLYATSSQVRERCELVKHRLVLPPAVSVETVDCLSEMGGGSVPGSEIQSSALRVTGLDIQALSERLRSGLPAVLAIIRDDAVLLDLRTVLDAQVEMFTNCVASAITSVAGESA